MRSERLSANVLWWAKAGGAPRRLTGQMMLDLWEVSMRRRAISIAISAALLVLLVPSYPLAAQTVTGTVKHGGTGEPIADARHWSAIT